MSIRKLIVALAAVGLGACAESTGPPLEAVRGDAPALHILQWKSGASPRGVRVTRSGPDILPDASRLSFSSTGVGGVESVSFWAVRGETRSIRIDYVLAAESGSFLEFTVPAGALSQLPDGTPLSSGDSVEITVTLDPTSLLVTFEPTGLQFSMSEPASLSLWYGGAEQDFDGDGEEEDYDDEYIESELLGIQYRELSTDPWAQIGASHSVVDKLFRVDLLHFSGYAVSW